MFEDEKDLVTEEVTENVEQTTEETQQTVKSYNQDELDAIVGKRLARQEAKIRKEYDRKYGRLEEVLKAGTGKEDVDEMTDTFEKFYESKGIKINKTPAYSEKDIEVLARAEADEIIRGGFEDVVDEVDRLAKKGAARMTAQEKAVFKVLAEHRANAERNNELAKIGVTADVYESKDFKEFASKFNSGTPITDIYDIYSKTKPKKEIKTAGSMKQQVQNSGVKDYYTPEEIERMTEEDLDDPQVWDAVRRSMTGR